MAMTLEMVLHVSAGSVGLLTGAAALAAVKGGRTHRSAGFWFVVSMVFMAVSGAIIAAFASVLISVMAGALSAYLVISGWLTARNRQGNDIAITVSILAMGAFVLLLGLYTSIRANHGVTDIIEGFKVPAGIYYTFTLFALLGLTGDVILLFRREISRKYRLSRHIWRISIPLYIATSSFFDGQQDVFPEALRGSLLLSLPSFLVVIALIYSLGKVWLDQRIASR